MRWRVECSNSSVYAKTHACCLMVSMDTYYPLEVLVYMSLARHRRLGNIARLDFFQHGFHLCETTLREKEKHATASSSKANGSHHYIYM